jgi:Initiator Replication protein
VLATGLRPAIPSSNRGHQPGRVPSARPERDRLLRVNRLIWYHRLVFDSVADAAIRSTYLPWVESITLIKTGQREELELALNSRYEVLWTALKQSLEKPGVRLKSQYSRRLYRWAKQYARVGYKRVSLARLRSSRGSRMPRSSLWCRHASARTEPRPTPFASPCHLCLALPPLPRPATFASPYHLCLALPPLPRPTTFASAYQSGLVCHKFGFWV